MAIEVGAEAGKVVLQEENAEELRRAELDQRKPGSGNCQKERNARRVNRTEQGARIALRGAEGDEDEGSQHRSDRSLGEHCDGVESVEEKEEDFPTSANCGQKWGPLRSGFQCWCPISAFFWQKWGSWAAIVHTRALVPAKPRQQRKAPRRGQQHVGRSCPGKAEDEGRRGDHQAGIEPGRTADAADCQKRPEHEQGGGHGRRNAGSPVADAEDGVGEHLSPVEQDGLFQPGVVVEDRGHPVAAGQHLARDLGVAGLVGAKQSEAAETEEEQKPAEPAKQHDLAQAGLAARHAEQCTRAGRIRQRVWVRRPSSVTAAEVEHFKFFLLEFL